MSEPRMIQRIDWIKDMTIESAYDWCVQRGLRPDQVTITSTHLKWESPQTVEEKERSDAYQQERDERTATWERETYERLRAKFDGGDKP